MAYRRKVYKKRFMKSKRKTSYKRKSFSKHRANKPSAYNGQVNVKCDLTKAATQIDTHGGVKFCILWGNPNTVPVAAPYNWPPDKVITPIETKEWIYYHDKYQEYRIVGCKMRFVPAGFVGD